MVHMRFSDKEIYIIEGYLKLAAAEGMASITLQKIAKATKISYGKAQFYFGGKSDLLMQGIVDYVGRKAQDYIFDYVEKNSEPSSKVKRYVNGTFQWVTDRPHHAVFWLYYYHLSSIKGTFRKKHPEYLRLAKRRLHDYICQDIGANIIAPTNNCTAKSAAIHAALVGNMLLSTTDQREQVDVYRKQALAYVDHALAIT